MTKTPHLQCTCEKCDNIDKMSSKLIGNQFSGIDRNLKKAMESMWCPFKDDLKEGRQFPDKNCVQRECQKCGVDQLKQKISYPQGTNFKKKVHWEEWIYQKIDKKKYKMANDLRTEDLQVLFDNYIDKMDDLSEHVFFDQWQHYQFKLLLENIEKGTIVFVHDFAKNILLRYQKEPQSHFWDHTQVTLHTTIAYYKCDCGHLITEYIYHVTSDKSHDWKAVDHFTRLSIEHLNQKGIEIKKIHEFTDQAPTQYKSCTIFNHLSQSHIPVC